MARISPLGQSGRLGVFTVYATLLLGIGYFATGRVFPLLDGTGLWFYSGMLALIVGQFLETPHFSRPVDGFVYSLLALVILLGYGVPPARQSATVALAAFAPAVVITATVLIASILAILLSRPGASVTSQRVGKTALLAVYRFARPTFLFSIVFLWSLVVFHRTNPRFVLIVGIGWALIVFGRPLEGLIDLWRRGKLIWESRDGTEFLGDVIAHETPGIVLIRHSGSAKLDASNLLVVTGDEGRANLAVPTGYVSAAGGMWMRNQLIPTPESLRDSLAAVLPSREACVLLRDGSLRDHVLSAEISAVEKREQQVGSTAPGTDTAVLKFEVIPGAPEVNEGQVIETEISGTSVLYQVLNGHTREEVLAQKNTRGFVEGTARKIGTWSTEKKQFVPTRWVPQPNTPVYLAPAQDRPPDPSAIGYFPGTSYPVTIEMSDLVTHNAAILGVLGIGKTFLALELCERMLAAGIRVICLDLTDQYARELGPFYRRRSHERVVEWLSRIGTDGKTRVSKNVEEGGSINQFRHAVGTVMRRFLAAEASYRLLALNPNHFQVWRQDSKPYQNRASMASLTAAEVTRVFSEAALFALQEQGMTREARCCLVYEEGHSLVPEWNAVAYEGDKAATNGTARAILQGRKFGLGCLLVTQRTASVTKTILNQCNTVFALRSFDATGMEFLSNFIGPDYAGILSSLEDRHAVVFGKASSCSDPVLIHVNDRLDFLQSIRKNSH